MNALKLSRRSANYSKAELNCLVKYLEENPEIVSVRLSAKYQNADDIRLAWEELADKISATGGYFGTRRTGQEIKRKWSDLKSRVKAKAASLAIDADKSDGEGPSIKLTPVEERVLAIISKDLEEQSHRIDSAHGSKYPMVKVLSFPHESNSGEMKSETDYIIEDEVETVEDGVDESGLLEGVRLGTSDNAKKRRITEAFSSPGEKRSATLKRFKITSEEEQLQALCSSQLELNAELRMVKDILKKTQQSVEKIAVLKRAELRLKCAKYGVEFEDLFD